MTTVKIDVGRGWRVFATDKGGNVDLVGGSDMSLVAATGHPWVTKYKITFKDSQTGNPTWPFTKKVNGDDAPDGHTEVLELTPGGSITRTLRDGALRIIKYDVAVEGDPPGPETEALALDPTIIIRPNSLANYSVLFGVTCAVLGAAAGALLTVLLTSRY